MNNLRLLRYVRSFLDGRVRIRHPALQDREVVEVVRKHLSAVRGVRSLQLNPDSGSVLILYDSAELPRERLIAVGTAWAVFLDDVYAGKKPEVPGC